ncbi:hypothetical protein DMUE_5950 [Dictyocoela muelleri]|nr:hypothetical protein DMUE_5950 [Dictyocoela muelleri]
MIFLLIIKILCAANIDEKTRKQKNNAANIINSNSLKNHNPRFNDFNHKFVNTPIQNKKFCTEKTPNSNDFYFKNFDSSRFSNYENNEERFYASNINSQIKSNAENHTTNDCTKHNEIPIPSYKAYVLNQHNFYKSINQNSSNRNPSPNNHFNSESQNNTNINQALEENRLHQSASKEIMMKNIMNHRNILKMKKSFQNNLLII